MDSKQPNILFILIDDMGWRDLSCYGSEFYETPNIDRLAAQGLTFTDAYAACPVCSPTRASLMSGKYPASVGVTDWIDHAGTCHPRKGRLIDVPYIKHLRSEEKSLAAALKDNGYATWHVGKWHLGGAPYLPQNHGFEKNVGGCQWGHPRNGYFSPWDIPGLPNGEDGEYLTDHLTDKAIELIRNRDERPFFLNMWYYSVHTPVQAKPEKIEKYRQKAADMGLDTKEPFAQGEVLPYLPFVKNGKGHVQRRIIQSDPVYAAMIESLDENIGRLLDTLEETGAADSTMVIFTSDNGGLATMEGSPTCNAPLAEGKGWMYEGGTREPLIIRWPDVVQPGTATDAHVTSPDFYPTLLDAAGIAPMPEQHTDGTGFTTLLKGDAPFERGPIYWHYPHYGNQGGTPGSSVRDGKYKLIEFFEDERLELYDLEADIGEDTNLADELPEVRDRLFGLLKEWQKKVEAKIPQANPEWRE